MFEAVKGAYMSVYTPAQKDISTDHVNYECIKNCVLSFLQPSQKREKLGRGESQKGEDKRWRKSEERRCRCAKR